ncbi:hypothetical protein GRI34_03000 [Erythrobacter aquimaris]|uniref:Thiamine biosynthesis protein ThiC n=1 Tax=Qipengyuania aquimaris TaxID=255984 RepID=A0A6I4THJ5_9SPHN|nr:hypothetical protein [Qipengyuania aquimaris]MXO95385.1 hypothetical protein [Qipengyuania aquimaris]
MKTQSLVGAVGAALLLTVASQVFYITVVSGSENEMLRPLTWFTELFAFSAVSIFALALAARRPDQSPLWAAIAVSGMLNLLQVGMGLSMFAPAMEASESEPQLFAAILAGAFFLYFLAKLILGAVAIALGSGIWRSGPVWAKGLGVLTALAGLGAIGLNLLAMVDAKAWTFPAGGVGTVATALVALSLLWAERARSTA